MSQRGHLYGLDVGSFLALAAAAAATAAVAAAELPLESEDEIVDVAELVALGDAEVAVVVPIIDVVLLLLFSSALIDIWSNQLLLVGESYGERRKPKKKKKMSEFQSSVVIDQN